MTLEERVTEGLQNEGYSTVSTHTDTAGALYKEHTHDRDTTHIVIKGTIEVTFNDTTYALKKGDRCDVPAGTPHTARVGDDGCTYVIGEK